MKLVFAGTPEFAAHALKAILAAGHQVALVLTQPDRPAGRGMALRPSPVKEIAAAAGIGVFQPPTLKDPAAWERLRAERAEAMVVAAYGLILPREVLEIPRFGCLNIHASLLPRWRGAAPIQRAILAGDAESGVCVMQMDARLDTGPVLRSERLPIVPGETAGSLHDKLAELGARLIVEALAGLPGTPVPQPAEGVSYAAKIEKAEAALDWRLSAARLERQIRAFNPFPGAVATLDGVPIKIWRAACLTAGTSFSASPGVVVSVAPDGIVVACGEGALRLTELQKAGSRRLPAAQFLSGNPVRSGASFVLPVTLPA
ncbi:MAG: methionyl-tRNA formyltransferase [Candidatus Accumulibacter sp.]|jgi:methionyl-tRNA formyltransferase|nr:methionyl-tRNA formyltransferase [Accumulibacter sp.]